MFFSRNVTLGHGLIDNIPFSGLGEFPKRNLKLRKKLFNQPVCESNVERQRGGIAFLYYTSQCTVFIRIRQQVFDGPRQKFDR